MRNYVWSPSVPMEIKSFLFRLVAIGKEAGMRAYASLYPDCDPKVMDYFYTFISSGCIAILEQWLKEGMKVPVEELALMSKGSLPEVLLLCKVIEQCACNLAACVYNKVARKSI